MHLRKWQRDAFNAVLTTPKGVTCLLMSGPPACGKSFLVQRVLEVQPDMRCFTRVAGADPSWQLLDEVQAKIAIRNGAEWYEESLDSSPVACHCSGSAGNTP